jgi:hypothetical protein
MEFSDVGEHCSDLTCKRQDYLPFKCEECNKYYCLDHRVHGCINKDDNVVTELVKYDMPKCSQKRCNKYILVDNICNNCHKNHCINHRFHNCPIKKDTNVTNIKTNNEKKCCKFFTIF